MTEFTLTSADPAAALAALNGLNVPIFHVAYLDNLTVSFRLRSSDISRVRQWADRRGEVLKLRRKDGLLWVLASLRKRKLLLAGCLLWLLVSLWLPTRVLFVRVEGNKTVPTKQILAAAEEFGIRFLADRREIRSEKMKNAILFAIPQLQWAGINTQGSVAVISVRESVAEPKADSSFSVSGIVAIRDAVVDSCTATAGNLLCTPGQTVKAGQVLISGYTDCGLYLRATQAEGEVYGLTNREVQVLSPQYTAYLSHPGETKRKISLLIGKKRINLWKDSGIWDGTCGRMYMEYYVTLPGGFALPFAVAVDTYQLRREEPAETAQDSPSLEEFAQQYLLQQMIAGEILSKREEIFPQDGAQFLSGSYVCREMIGRVRREQIGENYVEND